MKEGSKVRIGEVISDKMEKTVVVRIRRRISHSLYGKTMTVQKKVKAHDDKGVCKVGDMVRIEETRPSSKEKRWGVVERVDREKGIQGIQ